jgi:hypothetical protein
MYQIEFAYELADIEMGFHHQYLNFGSDRQPVMFGRFADRYARLDRSYSRAKKSR